MRACLFAGLLPNEISLRTTARGRREYSRPVWMTRRRQLRPARCFLSGSDVCVPAPQKIISYYLTQQRVKCVPGNSTYKCICVKLARKKMGQAPFGDERYSQGEANLPAT